MTTDELREGFSLRLRAIAKAATRGNWIAFDTKVPFVGTSGGTVIADCQNGHADAAFIAAFDPTRALAACDLADAAAAVVAAWVDDESGMATFDPECIDVLRAALDRWENKP